MTRAALSGLMLLAGCSESALEPPLVVETRLAVATRLGNPEQPRFSRIAKCGLAPMVSGNVALREPGGDYGPLKGFVYTAEAVTIEGEPGFAAALAACTAAIDAEGKRFRPAP